MFLYNNARIIVSFLTFKLKARNSGFHFKSKLNSSSIQFIISFIYLVNVTRQKSISMYMFFISSKI